MDINPYLTDAAKWKQFEKSPLDAFLELDDAVMKDIVDNYKYLRNIRVRKEDIDNRSTSAQIDLTVLQEDCKHPRHSTKQHSNEDEYGKMLRGGWFEYVCPDCGKHWSQHYDE